MPAASFVDGVSSTAQQEQRFGRSDKIADLRGKFDHPFRFFRLGHERLHVHRNHDRRFATMKDCALHRPGTLRRSCYALRFRRLLRVNTLHHLETYSPTRRTRLTGRSILAE